MIMPRNATTAIVVPPRPISTASPIERARRLPPYRPKAITAAIVA